MDGKGGSGNGKKRDTDCMRYGVRTVKGKRIGLGGWEGIRRVREGKEEDISWCKHKWEGKRSPPDSRTCGE